MLHNMFFYLPLKKKKKKKETWKAPHVGQNVNFFVHYPYTFASDMHLE